MPCAWIVDIVIPRDGMRAGCNVTHCTKQQDTSVLLWAASLLNPEEHMPDLIDDLRITACLSAREALEGGEHEVWRIFEVEKDLHAIKIIGWCIGVCAFFPADSPLP